MKIVVIIPTYNERENIGSLIEALEAEFEKLPDYEAQLLVVDDNSPDGTQEVVREKMNLWANIQMITGEKQGLGKALVRGFRYALDAFEPEVIVTMDADLSHNPQKVRELLAKIDEGFDYVLGSRYAHGGSIPREWGPHRKFLSFVGNIIARVLGVWEVHDLTPNFRAVRSRILQKINLEALPGGYAFQIALTCLARDSGAKLAEVPINFRDRIHGRSKMPLGTIFETLGFLLKYRLRKIKALLTNSPVPLVF